MILIFGLRPRKKKKNAIRINGILTKENEDSRIRINYFALHRLFKQEESKIAVTIYVSSNGIHKVLAEMVEKYDWNLALYDKSYFSKKEKQVDTRINVDVSTHANFHPKGKYRYVITSGDADMIPCIESVMKTESIVEIWSWNSSLSSKIKKLVSNLLGELLLIHSIVYFRKLP